MSVHRQIGYIRGEATLVLFIYQHISNSTRKHMKTIAKAVLLWATTIYTMLYVMAVDSLSLAGLFFGLLIGASLIYVCTKTIKEDELDTLLGNNIIKKIF